jgi:hypothetical protein
MRFTGGTVRRVGCSRYATCLRRAAEIEGKPTPFSCGSCDLFEPEKKTHAAILEENLRCANFWLAVFPELSTADTEGHQALNDTLDLPRFKADAEEIMRKAITVTAISS